MFKWFKKARKNIQHMGKRKTRKITRKLHKW